MNREKLRCSPRCRQWQLVCHPSRRQSEVTQPGAASLYTPVVGGVDRSVTAVAGCWVLPLVAHHLLRARQRANISCLTTAAFTASNPSPYPVRTPMLTSGPFLHTFKRSVQTQTTDTPSLEYIVVISPILFPLENYSVLTTM